MSRSKNKYPVSVLTRLAQTIVVCIAALPLLAPAQSLWKEESAKSMIADRKARAVGDIITIVIQENNTASKDNSTSTGKKTAADAAVSSFFYPPSVNPILTMKGQMPALKFNATHDFAGSGKISNSEKITARLAARVVEVLPNGNLIIEGTRLTAFAGETQEAVLHGIVRSEDVTASNTIFSYNISDATIKYVSRGSVSDAQKKGWFTRVWDKLTPF